MARIRRGGYVLVSWKGDHAPRHVHVYRNGALVLKWDLESRTPMQGRPSRRLLRILEALEREGLL